MSPTFFGGPPPVIRPAGVTAAPRPPWRSAVRCGRAWPARRQSAICERTKTQRTQIKACERFMPHGYDARSWVPNSGCWPFGYLCVTWHTHSRSPHADVLLCAFVNAGTGVTPFAEDHGSGAGWPATGAARLAGSPGASEHAHLAPRFSPRGHPLWYAGKRAVTYAPSPTSDPEPRTDRMPGSSLSADRRRRANAVVFFPHRKAWLFLFRSAQVPRNASRNSSRDRRGGAIRPAAGVSPPGRRRIRRRSSSWSHPGR